MYFHTQERVQQNRMFWPSENSLRLTTAAFGPVSGDDARQQLQAASFLLGFTHAVNTSLEADTVCTAAAIWLYQAAHYTKIIFAFDPASGLQPVAFMPTWARKSGSRKVQPLRESQDLLREELTPGESDQLQLPSEGYCTVNLAQGLGHVLVIAPSSVSHRLCEIMVDGIAEALSGALRNALTHRQLRELSVRDSLSELFNRRAFEEFLDMEERKREVAPLALLLLDLDDFKSINDSYGHQAGDEVIAQIGRILRENSRGADLAARYGGEEFAVLLPGASPETASMVAERLRAKIAATPFTFDGITKRITASIGIALRSAEQHSTMSELLNRADQALYRAKRTGKNRVIIDIGDKPHSAD